MNIHECMSRIRNISINYQGEGRAIMQVDGDPRQYRRAEIEETMKQRGGQKEKARGSTGGRG